ncbi:hypothetical protein BJF92_12085 [Rhizobium rhizosphaerae]|uniref:Uncharacterized protein n=1 Tax=Xaviernesmea rhizosphaerae TaxID=1672749 RepID=A0A1Q9AN42_9HYPH|nr:hypothetical protein [Xaviernesmea rhizosphaerae]OLP56804.1 hypothetical protein BJF92_12085 [Xaviernesmea rhizosphaerae]
MTPLLVSYAEPLPMTAADRAWMRALGAAGGRCELTSEDRLHALSCMALGLILPEPGEGGVTMAVMTRRGRDWLDDFRRAH